MARVAVIRSRFLPLSETFIYSELVRLRHTEALVCTKEVMNQEHFPFNKVFRFDSSDKLRDILVNERVDLIHARFGLTGLEVLDVKQQLDIPMLTSFHGFDLPSNSRSLKRYGDSLPRLFEAAELFTAVSEDMKKTLIQYGCPRDKIYVHHSGIDLDQFVFRSRTASQSCITLLSVGRFVEKKGMADLIDAFATVAANYPLFRLRIVGDGPLLASLQAKVHALQLEDRVAFLGAASHAEVAREMQQAHLFALASRRDEHGNQEGIPNALKEAMACGLPVVSTWHAGIPELVQHGVTGFLVPERSPDALAAAIEKLVESPDTWRQMGLLGRKVVESGFSALNQVEELENLYQKVLHEKASSD